MSDRPSRILARLWLVLPRRIVPSLNLDMFYIFLGIRYDSPYLLYLPAKEGRKLMEIRIAPVIFRFIDFTSLFVGSVLRETA
jgi:hypothetical protein